MICSRRIQVHARKAFINKRAQLTIIMNTEKGRMTQSGIRKMLSPQDRLSIDESKEIQYTVINPRFVYRGKSYGEWHLTGLIGLFHQGQTSAILGQLYFLRSLPFPLGSKDGVLTGSTG